MRLRVKVALTALGMGGLYGLVGVENLSQIHIGWHVFDTQKREVYTPANLPTDCEPRNFYMAGDFFAFYVSRISTVRFSSGPTGGSTLPPDQAPV